MININVNNSEFACLRLAVRVAARETQDRLVTMQLVRLEEIKADVWDDEKQDRYEFFYARELKKESDWIDLRCVLASVQEDDVNPFV